MNCFLVLKKIESLRFLSKDPGQVRISSNNHDWLSTYSHIYHSAFKVFHSPCLDCAGQTNRSVNLINGIETNDDAVIR